MSDRFAHRTTRFVHLAQRGHTSRIGAVLVALSTVCLSSLAFAEEKREVTCYPSSADSDGDGYAIDGTAGTELLRPESVRYSCPSGWVPQTGDCDDGNAAVHPRRDEVAFNAVDDNCDGSADNTEYVYFASNVNMPDRVLVVAKINNLEVGWLGFFGADLYARVRYRPYSAEDSSANITTGYIPVSLVEYTTPEYGPSLVAALWLPGLSSNTAYRAQARFYVKEGSSFRRINSYDAKVFSTVTPSTSSTLAAYVRAQVAMSALKQLNEHELGLVGWDGTADPNGTRYGADLHEAWCSEFYGWNARDWLDGIYPSVSNTTKMKNFFGSSYRSGSTHAQNTLPGEWVALDTNGDGETNHSAVFLAYRSSTNEVVTVDGNTSNNQVRIRSRALNTVKGVGWITSSLVE